MRGDRPGSFWSEEWDGGFTPHARGSTFQEPLDKALILVYPACAGIDHNSDGRDYSRTGLPRMRGDRPLYCAPYDATDMFTPHARGSTATIPPGFCGGKVYPACAGIDPWSKATVVMLLRLPRMRGDRPLRASGKIVGREFTPHARGSTWLQM